MNEQINEICVLHIGKAGGNYLRSILRHNKNNWSNPLHLMGPRTNLTRTAKTFGPNRKLAFVIRDPAQRFVSAFNARGAQDRPHDERPWTPEEAIAFGWFKSAEDLALALSSDDPIELSAARFAMLHIGYMNETYESCFGSTATLINDVSNVAMCIDLPQLDAKLPRVMAKMGIDRFEFPDDPPRNPAEQYAEELSLEARAGLRCHWPEEFKLYSAARRISDTLFR